MSVVEKWDVDENVHYLKERSQCTLPSITLTNLEQKRGLQAGKATSSKAVP